MGQQRGEFGGRARLAGVVWALSLSLAALAWVFSSPVGASPDEPAHLAYAWSVITGQGFGGPDDSRPNSVPQFDVDVPRDVIPEPACYAFHPELSSGCAAPSVVSPYPTYMTRYPPLYYYAAGAGMWVADAGGMTATAVGYAGRLVGALLGLSVLIPAGLLAISRFRGALPLVVAAMTAMAWFMIGSVNPSGLEIAAAIAAAVAAGSLFRGRVESARWLFAYSVTLLAWARPIGFLWAGMIIVFGIAFAATHQGTRDAIRSYGWSLIVGSATTLAAIGWFIYALGARSAIGAGASAPTAAVERIFAISLRWGGMVWENAGVLGWLDTPLPDLAMISVIALIAIIAADSARRIDSAGASRLMVVYVLTLILGITLLMAVQVFLWQGRYVLPPMAAGLVLLGFSANPTQLRKTGRIAASILYTIAVTAAVWVYLRHAIGFETAARYQVPAFAREATWSGPLGPWTVALLALGSAALMVWLLLMLNDQQSDLDQVPTSSG